MERKLHAPFIVPLPCHSNIPHIVSLIDRNLVAWNTISSETNNCTTISCEVKEEQTAMLNTLLLLLLAFIPCQAQYPFLRWSSNVLGQRGLVNGGFRKGNGVVLSKNQGELWATDALGSLHVIHLHENRDHVVFTPNSLSGRATESRSSVALFEGGESSFAIYAVLDVPLDVNDAVQR